MERALVLSCLTTFEQIVIDYIKIYIYYFKLDFYEKNNSFNNCAFI